ncbi:MAG: hypothetical protein ABI632_01895 [Pseudolysinimonas sp.]
MRAQARPPRRKWPWIVVAGLLVAAAIAVTLWYTSQHPATPAAPTSAPTTSAAPAAEPTGCLVPGQDVQMLLDTQKKAPHSTTGAVEFAAALLRWLHQYPNPSTEDAAIAQREVMASTSDYDLVEALKDNPNTSNALVPNDTDYHLTTGINNYLVESYSDSAASITLNGTVFVNGAINPQLVIATTYALVWEKDAWRVDSSSRPEPGRLAAVGKPFTGGC